MFVVKIIYIRTKTIQLIDGFKLWNNLEDYDKNFIELFANV